MPKIGMEPYRRVQIINATLECIANSGLEGLTLDTIAKGAGVSKGVASYYFKGKDEIILQSFRFFLDYYNQKVANTVLTQSSALEMLFSMVDIVINPEQGFKSMVNINDENRADKQKYQLQNLTGEGYFVVLVHFYSRLVKNKNLQNVYLEMYQKYLDGIIEILRYGVENKEFKVVNLLPTALIIMSQLDGIILYETLGFQPLGKKEVTKTCKTFIQEFLIP